jgi:hypothetical protein
METLLASRIASAHKTIHYIHPLSACVHAEVALGLIVGCLPPAPRFLPWADDTQIMHKLRSVLRLAAPRPGCPAPNAVSHWQISGQQPLEKASVYTTDT